MSKIDNIKGHLLGISIIIFIVIITTRNLIFYAGYPAGVDSLPPIKLISFLSEKGGSFNIWEDTDMGYVTPITLYHVLSLLNISIDNPSLIFKALYIFLSLGIGFGMYLYVYGCTKSKIASIASSIIFLTNQWILAKMASGQMNHVFAYFLIPILFLYIDKCLRKCRLTNIIILSFILSIFILLRIDPIIYVLPFLILYILFVIVTTNKKIRFETIKNTIKIFLIGGILFIGFTFFVLFPIIKLGGATHGSISFPLDDVKKNSLDISSAVLGNIRQMSYIFWKANTDWNTHQFLTLSQYELIMLIIPLLAFLAIFIRKIDNRVIFFISAAMISIFLAKGPNPPIGEIYSFLYQNIPLFDKLREPDRWTMVTWFSYAYLTGTTLKFLADRFGVILKRYTNINCLHNDYRYMILLILLPSFLGTWYIFSNGYEIWNPPSEEVGVYNKISTQYNGSRVATVPYGFTHMFNYDLGLEADIGRQSSLFSDMSVFAVGSEFKNDANDFYKYTQLLAWEELTNNTPKIFGIYDVRFFVLQGYPVNAPSPTFGNIKEPTYKQHDFFERQIGLKKIYEGKSQNYTMKVGESWTGTLVPKLEPPKLRTITVERPPKVYENKYWIPRIFSPSSQLLMIGGTESFLKLAEVDNFNFDKWNIIFADHVYHNEGKETLKESINRSDDIVFVNSESLDLTMLLANVTWIEAKDYNKDSTGWKEDDWPVAKGFFVYNRDVITANMEGSISAYNVEITNDSSYEIWIRALLYKDAGKLKILYDGNMIGELNTKDSRKLGFKWIKVRDIRLKKGKHKIDVINNKGRNSINGIIIAEKGDIDNTLNYTEKLINKKSIYLLDKEKYDRVKNIERNVVLYQNNIPLKNVSIKERLDNVKYIDFIDVNPSKWVVKVNSTASYTLVFSNTYHPMWRAYVNGREYKSLPSYYFINSFHINETGEQEVVIEFIGQRIENFSLIISGLVYLMSICYILYDWRKNRDSDK